MAVRQSAGAAKVDLELAPRPTEQGGVRDFIERLIRARLAGVGLVLIFLFTFSALFADHLAPYSPLKQKVSDALRPPSAEHWLGTDDLGRDILSRVIYGGQVSLEVGVISAGLALLVGTALGLMAGYWSNSLLDQLIMRTMDGLLAFPALILALAIIAALGPSQAGQFPKAIWAIAIVGIPVYARLTRGQVLSARELEYIVAARTAGASDVRIMVRHILPNVVSPLIVQASLGVATAILVEAALSFLGLGVQPPTPSWGSMLDAGRGYLEIDPWLIIGPGAAIFLAVLGFNFVGDGIRDVLDPRLWNR
jgi:peptide/nickel transport system permease protein